MITEVVYIVIAVYLGYMAYRLAPRSKRENPITNYFFWAIFVTALGQINAVAMIAAYFVTGNSELLYWADVIGRTFLYLNPVFFVQMPLYVFLPKSKWRIAVSYVMAALVPFATYALATNHYSPFLEGGIIQWETPTRLIIFPGIIMMLVWLGSVGVFLYEYTKSHTKKSLFIAIGFFLIAIGAFVQDYADNPMQYILVNIVLLAGFVLQFMSLVVSIEEM